MTVKETLSRIIKNPYLLGSIAGAGVLLVVVYLSIEDRLLVDARQQSTERHYGLTMKMAANRVDAYIAHHQQQLRSLAEKPSVIDTFLAAKSSEMDAAEQQIRAEISDAETIYFIDPAMNRHASKLGYAAKYMLRQGGIDLAVPPRAIKIDNQWHVLFSQTVQFNRTPIGTLLVELPIEGLRYALSSADNNQGLMRLQQASAEEHSAVIVELGDTANLSSSPHLEVAATENPLWTLTLSLSEEAVLAIEQSLPPFKLFFGGFVVSMLLVLYFTVRYNLRERAPTAIEVPETGELQPPVPKKPPLRSKTAKTVAAAQPNSVDTALPLALKKVQPPTQDTDTLAIREPEEVLSALQLQIMQNMQTADDGIDNVDVPDVAFRDYDIRGIAGTEIDEAFANRLGRALGTVMRRSGEETVYLARDGRLSSPKLADAMQAGLLASGCSVVYLGEITTPALNFALHYGGHSSSGIMVTASHNPAIYNGFKIIIQQEVISGQLLQLLKPMVRGGHFAQGEGTLSSADIIPRYISHITETCVIDETFKLVIDGANSVPGPIALKLFDSLGCMAFPLYCTIDGAFPNHEPNPSEVKNLAALQAKVLEQGADLGFAFDGDGDRVVVISAQGRIVWPDQLMMIFARDVLARNPGSDIVFDVKSSKRLAELIRQHSGRPVMCKTGHAHVRKQVHDNDAPLGGEFSGHIFFNDRWKGFDDGLYAAVRLLEILSSLEQTLDQVIDGLESSVSTPEILIPVKEEEKFSLMQTLATNCEFEQAHIVALDGLRVEYPYGWGLIRASNTSANLTLRFEADDDDSLEMIKLAFQNVLKPYINNMEDYF